jgi:hypothetical protein
MIGTLMKTLILVAGALPLVAFILSGCSKTSEVEPGATTGSAQMMTVDGRTLNIGETDVQTAHGTIHLKKQSLLLPAPPAKTIKDEKFDLVPFAKQDINWECAPAGTKIYGLLQPRSLINSSLKVKKDKGERAALLPETEYHVDATWPLISSTGQSAHQQVFLDYQVRQNCISTVAFDSAGVAKIISGSLSLGAPVPAQIPSELTPVANVLVRSFDQAVRAEDIMAIRYPPPNPPAVNQAMTTKAAAKLKSGKPILVEFIGDSVTCGASASSLEKSFPVLFISELHKKYPNAQIKVARIADGGTHSDTEFAKFRARVGADFPDLAIVEFVNDVALDGKTLQERYRDYFTMLTSHGTECIVCLPHMCSPSVYGFKANDWQSVAAKPYYSVIPAVAKDTKAGVANVFERCRTIRSEGLTPELLLADGQMHPNDRGHQLYVEELMRFFP